MSQSSQSVIPKSNKQAEGRDNRPSVAARTRQDEAARRTFFIITLLPVALILIITIALLVRTWPIMSAYRLTDLIFGEVWKPSWRES